MIAGTHVEGAGPEVGAPRAALDGAVEEAEEVRHEEDDEDLRDLVFGWVDGGSGVGDQFICIGSRSSVGRASIDTLLLMWMRSFL